MSENVAKRLISIVDNYPEDISHSRTEAIPLKTFQGLYVSMLRIRRFEEKVVELLFNKEIKCPTHLYIGQEAIAAGVCANLGKSDYVFSNHRSTFPCGLMYHFRVHVIYLGQLRRSLTIEKNA